MLRLLKNWVFGIRLHHVVLGFILMIGLWLRLANLPHTMWFYSGMDEARDVLVGKHIVEYHDKIIRGPFAAGGYFWLQNSPFYYYLMAVIWFIGRGAVASDVIWILISSSGIVLSYWAGTLTRNKSLGLLAALFYAVHPSLIMVSTQIMQPHVLPLFALWFYCSLLTGIKEKSGWWLLVAGFWLLIPMHFHYAGLLLWPMGGLALIISWYFASKQNWIYWKVFLIFSLLLSLNLGLFWLVLTYKYEMLDQFYFFTLNQNKIGDPFWIRVTETAVRFKNLMFGYSVADQQAIIITGSLLLGWIITQRKRLTEYLMLLLALSTVLSLSFRSYVAETYLLSFIPFWILLWACVVHNGFKFRKWLGIGLLLLTFGWCRDITATMQRDWPRQNFYEQYQQASVALYQDYLKQDPGHTNQGLPRFAIAALASYIGFPYDGWSVAPFWFFLENLTGQKLVRLTNFDTNFFPITEKTDFVYLVCDARDKPEDAEVMCYQTFTGVRNYLDAGTLIYVTNSMKIWRFSIDQAKKPEHVFHVYQEYM